MFNPCIEHCYNRYGKQYSSDCDDKCEYAKMANEYNLLKNRDEQRKKIFEEIKSVILAGNHNTLKKHGVLYIMTKNELEYLIHLIAKLVR